MLYSALVYYKNHMEDVFMFETLKSILVEEYQVDPAEITLDSDLRNDLGINSIELAELVMTCEEKFDVEFSDEDINSIATIGDVIKYLEGNA